MLNRRNVLVAGSMFSALGALGACASATAGADLNIVRNYTSVLVNALSAAAATYVANPAAKEAALVNKIVADLQILNASVQDVTDISTVKSALLQILPSVGILTPILTPLLGAAAPYLPLAVAVLTAFVQALPLPGPTTPPAALTAKALEYRH